MHLHSVGSISPSWWVCVGLYYVILYYLRLDQIRLDKILIISMTLMISSGTMNQREEKLRWEERKPMCVLVGAQAFACVFGSRGCFDPRLPNESKTRQQGKGRPFKTHGWIVTDKPLAAHPSVSTNVQLSRAFQQGHTQTPALTIYCNSFFIFKTFYIVDPSWRTRNYKWDIRNNTTKEKHGKKGLRHFL